MRLSATVTGLDEAIGRITGLGDRAERPQRAFQQVYAAFQATERARFDTQGFGSWAPDLPSTVRRKARRGGDIRTLRQTGMLYRSLTAQGAGAVFRVRGDQVEMGTAVPEARYQYRPGSDYRPVLGASRRDAESWAEIIAAYVLAGSQ